MKLLKVPVLFRNGSGLWTVDHGLFFNENVPICHLSKYANEEMKKRRMNLNKTAVDRGLSTVDFF